MLFLLAVANSSPPLEDAFALFGDLLLEDRLHAGLPPPMETSTAGADRPSVPIDAVLE